MTALSIHLPDFALYTLRAEAERQGLDPEDLASLHLAALYSPEPTYIEEGSPEEQKAIEEGLALPAHLLDRDAVRRKYGLPADRTDADRDAAFDAEVASLTPARRA